jgi:hypothetical protein
MKRLKRASMGILPCQRESSYVPFTNSRAGGVAQLADFCTSHFPRNYEQRQSEQGEGSETSSDESDDSSSSGYNSDVQVARRGS